jgi:pSer/pThr/pTyr-binding forkhead associated (FHA) protein
MDATLVMFKSSGERRDFSLLKEVTTVGRNDDCDLRIPLAGISRGHCRFVINGTKVIVEDLKSTNGTFVNSVRLQGKQDLRPGDQVMVGPVIFTLQVDGQPGDITPTGRTSDPRSEAGTDDTTRLE